MFLWYTDPIVHVINPAMDNLCNCTLGSKLPCQSSRCYTSVNDFAEELFSIPMGKNAHKIEWKQIIMSKKCRPPMK